MIFVTGADGFLGRHLVPRLLEKGHRLRALLLPGRWPPVEHAALEWVEGDLTQAASLHAAIGDAECVVHLAAILANPDLALNLAVNEQGTVNLLAAAERARTTRFLYMSAAAAKFPTTTNAYARSKRGAESAVASSALDFAIVRVPLVIGAECGEWNRFIDYVGKFPAIVPVFGRGTTVKRPVHVDDVVAAITALLDRGSGLGRRVWEIAPREPMSLDEMIDSVLRARGQRKKKIHLPLSLSLALAGAAEKILGSRAPVTRDIIRGMNADIDFVVEPALSELNLDPMSPGAAIAREIGPFRA